MLNDFEKDTNMSQDFDEREEDKEEEKDQLFGLGEDRAVLNRVTRGFEIAKSRALNSVTLRDYVLSPAKRAVEMPTSHVENDSYQKALFYMYGACEGFADNKVFVHNLLQRYGIWDGSVADAQ